MQELRRPSRTRSFLRGEIVHSAGAFRIDCTVRDTSPGGARLQVPSSVPIPDPFELKIGLHHLTERSAIIWRRGSELGVQFVRMEGEAERDGLPASASDTSIEARLEKLEAEVRLMKRQLAALRPTIERLSFDQS